MRIVQSVHMACWTGHEVCYIMCFPWAWEASFPYPKVDFKKSDPNQAILYYPHQMQCIYIYIPQKKLGCAPKMRKDSVLSKMCFFFWLYSKMLHGKRLAHRGNGLVQWERLLGNGNFRFLLAITMGTYNLHF